MISRSSRPTICDEASSRAARATAVEAVRGVDLEVGAGQIFGFLGPNGAGKTTTLRMLATLLPPDVGHGDRRRRRPRDPAGARPRADRLRAAGRLDRSGRDRPRRARPPGPPVRHGQGRRGTPRRARCSPPSTSTAAADRQARHVVGRHAPPARRRPRHRPPAGASLFLDEPTTGLDPQARARHVGRDPAPARRRDDGLPHDPLPRGGRRAVRPARDHRPRARSSPRARPTSSSARSPATSSRSASTAPTEHVLETVRAQPFVREASGEDGVVRLYVDHGETAVPQLLRLLDGAGLRRVARSPSIARASTTSSSARPAARSATKPRPEPRPITDTSDTTTRNPPCSSSATPGSSSDGRCG